MATSSRRSITLCGACQDLDVRTQVIKAGNHGIVLGKILVSQDTHVLRDKDHYLGSETTYHSFPGYSRLPFCLIYADLKEDDDEERKDEIIYLGYRDDYSQETVLYSIGEAGLAQTPFDMDTAAVIAFASLKAAAPGSVFLQGSYPLFCLEKILSSSSPPSWAPSDLDFFISTFSKNHFEKAVTYFSRLFRYHYKVSGNKMIFSVGEDEVSIDFNRLKRKGSDEVRKACDISVASVQIVHLKEEESAPEGFETWPWILPGTFILCPIDVLDDIRAGTFRWQRETPKPRFIHTLQGHDPASVIPFLPISPPDTWLLPSRFHPMFQDVDPHFYADLLDQETPVVIHGPEKIHKRDGWGLSPPQKLYKFIEVQENLMGGFLHIGRSFYLDRDGFVWTSDGETYAFPGVSSSEEETQPGLTLHDLLGLLADPGSSLPLYDHKEDAMLQKRHRRYWVSSKRRDKYEGYGYTMAERIEKNPEGEDEVEYHFD